MFYSFHTYSAEDETASVRGITCGSGVLASHLPSTLSVSHGLHANDGPLGGGTSPTGRTYTNLDTIQCRQGEPQPQPQQQDGPQNVTQTQLPEYPNTYERRSLPFDPYNNSGSKLLPSVPWDHVYSSEALSNNSTLAAMAVNYPYALSMGSEDYPLSQDHHQVNGGYPGYYPLPDGSASNMDSEMNSSYRHMTTMGHPNTANIITPTGFNGFGPTGSGNMYLTNSNAYYPQHMPIYNHTSTNEYLPSVAQPGIMKNDYPPLPHASIPNSFPMVDCHSECLAAQNDVSNGAVVDDHYWSGGAPISTSAGNFPPALTTTLNSKDDAIGQMETTDKLQDLPSVFASRSVFGYAMRSRIDAEGLFTPRIQSALGRETATNPFSISLLNQNMWYDFYQNQTEMIITKTGRRMFPYLSIEVGGLDENKQYNVFVDVQQICSQILKYHSGRWVPNGEGELWPPSGSCRGRIYMHPDSPNSGRHWMKQEIHFMKLKLTNNKVISEEDDGNMIVVNSMHNYIPRINVVEVDSSTMNKFYAIATFPVTEFIVVTAYQNTEVTELKIKYNPFAKGFRETNKSNTAGDHSTTELMKNLSQNVESKDSKWLYYIPSVNEQNENSIPYIPRVQIIQVPTESENQNVGIQEFRQSQLAQRKQQQQQHQDVDEHSMNQRDAQQPLQYQLEYQQQIQGIQEHVSYQQQSQHDHEPQEQPHQLQQLDMNEQSMIQNLQEDNNGYQNVKHQLHHQLEGVQNDHRNSPLHEYSSLQEQKEERTNFSEFCNNGTLRETV